MAQSSQSRRCPWESFFRHTVAASRQ